MSKLRNIKRWSVLLAVIIVNLLLLRFFNTAIWPYFWPRPGVFILLALLVVDVWYPDLFSGIWLRRLVGIATIFVGECYLMHSFQVLVSDFSPVALIHFIGISGSFIVIVIGIINQLNPKDNRQAPQLPSVLPHVAAVIPTYGEPVEVLERTLCSLTQLDYPADNLTILISDDGDRAEVQNLASKYNVDYIVGARKDAKAGNLNGILAYLNEQVPQVTLILTQDADESIHPEFLKKVVGYFEDPKIAFVQTPKDAMAPQGDPFGVRDRTFYDRVQPGRNGHGAAFSCGSGVLWRISAVLDIGGFSTWNIVEDLTTSYLLHSAGYRSEYHNEVLTIGLAPDDIPGLLKQRGTWATDTWRLFLFKNPLRMPGLTLSQRLQYLELGLFYVSSSFFIPMIMLTPLLSLLTKQFVPIKGSALFPWIFFSFLYYMVLAGGQSEFFLRMWQYWVSHAPTYHRAFWIAIRSRNNKPKYKVTRKTRQDGFYGQQLWPQFLYLFLGVIASLRGLFWMPEVAWDTRLVNVLVLCMFMFMTSSICVAAFHNISLPQLSRRFIPILTGRRNQAYQSTSTD